MKKSVITFAALAFLICSLCLVSFMWSYSAPAHPVLTLEAEHGILGGNAAVWGEKVGNMGLCGGDNEGTCTFVDLDIPKDGVYTLVVHYYSGSDDRYFDISTDNEYYKLDCPNTGGFDVVGTITLNVELTVGGVIIFGSDWYGPDLDKIEIFDPSDMEFGNRYYPNPENYDFKDILRVDTNNGVYSILSNGKAVVENAHGEVKLGDEIVSSDDFESHEYSTDGNTLVFIHKNHPSFKGEMRQEFVVKSGYVVTALHVTADNGELSSNYISPLAGYKECVKMDSPVFLKMPFDNDKWVEPEFISADKLGRVTNGYEVGAFLDSKGAGFVFGSVSHQTWKTGVNVYSKDGVIMGMELFGGAADSNTRDNSPHGMVSGKTISSPHMFLGVFDNWRNGLTAYGKANCDVAPKKQSVDKVPFGFNSWGALQSEVKYSDMVAVSNFISENLDRIWSKDDGAIYVNIDSFWDYITHNDPSCNMTLDQALAEFVNICRDNGQKAGIYFTPFACWHSSEDEMKNSFMEGSDHTYFEAATRKADGSLYGQLDGGFALDPTHPGTIARIENRLNYFIELGFEYIKLDFLTHGAVEGSHYDKSVTTGMQAYNLGMKKIHDICNGKMFVNLSIAPVFPYQYADGRRISCDAFASIDNTKHVLSYLTACFWHKEIYSYPDPDHLVACGVSEGEARCRVTSGVISGTSFIVGDYLGDAVKGSEKYNRVMKMFGNEAVVDIAKLGFAFMPYEAVAGQRCADVYYLVQGGNIYLAVFNFDSRPVKRSLDIAGIFPEIKEGTKGVDVWRNSSLTVNGTELTCTVPAKDVVLVKLDTNNVVPKPTQPAVTVTPDNTPTQSEQPETTSTTPEHTEKGEEKGGNAIAFAIMGGVLLLAVIVVVILVVKKSKKS